jgi:hemoglobin
LIDAFYDRVERDDLLSPFFPGGVSAEHRRHVAAWWTEVRRVDRVHRPAGRLRAALVGYLEWGTRLAAENSQRGAAPAEHAPVPRWGRGVAPPYVP